MTQKVQFFFCVLLFITFDDGEENDILIFFLEKLENKKVRDVYEARYKAIL